MIWIFRPSRVWVKRRAWSYLYAAVASRDEWDDFEGRFAAGRIREALRQPSAEARDAGVKQASDWYQAYLKWGREVMGFGYYVYRVPVA